MERSIQNGVLVLADITGFTEFVTATELEHGGEIIAALLEAVMRRLSPPLEIQEVEGDAVFAVGPDGVVAPRSRLLDVLDDAFNAFKKTQRELAADESCSCSACRRVPDLDLKIVGHHGRFVRQLVGGRSQLAGVDVVLAHRLLKNRLAGRRGYLLLTEGTLRWLGVDGVHTRLTVHVERYEHLGEVRCFVGDLPLALDESPAAFMPITAA